MNSDAYIEIHGKSKLLCQGRAELEAYTDGMIRIKTVSGTLAVIGESLRLGYMSDDRIMIFGIIEGVRYE